jgi:glutamate synthase (NADPH/NADH) small chain
MGFTGPVKNGMNEQMGVRIDARGNVATNEDTMSSWKAERSGDTRRGQSLVVWANAEGRNAPGALMPG